MSIFRKEQNQVHSMQGNHIAGVATPTSGAQAEQQAAVFRVAPAAA